MNTKIPVWFWVVSTILLIWNLVGLLAFFIQMNLDMEALQNLPSDQRELQTELLSNYPIWAKAGYALAVFGWFTGALLLLMKKKIARKAFIISLIGMSVQLLYTFKFIGRSVDMYGPAAIAMPVMIFLLVFYSIWLAGFGEKKSWLA
ncbi:MAG: hypothetical protein DWQ33_08515 [Bacteroidetes bacterium]|nr:MAG: hypothetical protein DWQ33_08515 [Bacteroidota bacterium]